MYVVVLLRNYSALKSWYAVKQCQLYCLSEIFIHMHMYVRDTYDIFVCADYLVTEGGCAPVFNSVMKFWLFLSAFVTHIHKNQWLHF